MKSEMKELFLRIEKILGRKLKQSEKEVLDFWYSENVSIEIIEHLVKYCVLTRKISNFPYINTVIQNCEETSIDKVRERYLISEDKQDLDEKSTISIRIGYHSRDEKLKVIEQLQKVFILEKINSEKNENDMVEEYTYLEVCFKNRY